MIDQAEQIIVILCIAGLAAYAMYIEPATGKDITIAAVSGLVGYLSKANKVAL